MRDIKFRAKDLNTNEWRYGYLVVHKYPRETNIYKIYDYLGNDWTVDEETVCQYTGLKDKNGKEIYEGDILDDKAFVEWFDRLTWDSGGSMHSGFYCRKWFEYNNVGELSYHYGFNNVEVIGNRFDGAHLLDE